MATARIELELPDQVYTLEALKADRSLFDPDTGMLSVPANMVLPGSDGVIYLKLLSLTDAKKANQTVTRIAHESRKQEGYRNAGIEATDKPVEESAEI